MGKKVYTRAKYSTIGRKVSSYAKYFYGEAINSKARKIIFSSVIGNKE
jgi:hypothetical protein